MKQTFNVKGMHCSSCEMLVQGSLEDAGAKSVEASHENETITVDFDEAKLKEDDIKRIIREEGYQVI
jgi:copper chaperone CopZ